MVASTDIIGHPGDLTAGVGVNLLGLEVAISGDTAIVGAPLDDTIAGDSAGSALIFRRTPSGWEQQARLIAGDTAAGDEFGSSVAIEGDTAIVGASGHDHSGMTDAGAVYVFTRVGDEWTLRTKLAPADPSASASFGHSASLDGGTLIVGASGWPNHIGAVYSFVGADATWLQEAKIVPDSDAAGDVFGGDAFGGDVALHGDTVVVGASRRTAGSNIRWAGSAFVFVREAGIWTQQAELHATNPARDDFFGRSVALHGDTMLVGGTGFDPESGLGSGAAFVFQRTGSQWSAVTRLVAPGSNDDLYFGSSVALSGTRAVVGAPWHSRAYVFANTGSGWLPLDTLTTEGGEFGAAMALSDDTVVIGAPYADRVGGRGAAYFFTESGSDWVEENSVDGGDSATRDRFGSAMAVSGDTLVVGVPNEGVGMLRDVGAAYVYTRAGASWVLQASLRRSNGEQYDYFGASVAVDGDTIAIGRSSDSDEAVHIFVRDNGVWTERALIVSPDPPPINTNRFGDALALNGGTLVVGAPWHHTAGSNFSGAAYVFTGGDATWQLQAILSTGIKSQTFGSAVALSGDVAIVGAPPCSESNGGRAYVFVRNQSTWTQQAELLPDPTPACQGFGAALSLLGDQVLVGAPYGDTAYIFGRNGSTWDRIARLDVGMSPFTRTFGKSVALSQDTALVGAFRGNFDFPEPGAAYLFARSGSSWAPRGRFASPAGAADEFGQAVALSGFDALVGVPVARGVFSGHYGVGAVHVYGFTPPVFFSGFE